MLYLYFSTDLEIYGCLQLAYYHCRNVTQTSCANGLRSITTILKFALLLHKLAARGRARMAPTCTAAAKLAEIQPRGGIVGHSGRPARHGPSPTWPGPARPEPDLAWPGTARAQLGLARPGPGPTWPDMIRPGTTRHAY
jgi:hypothetical protein